MKTSCTASVEFAVDWQCQGMKHCDRYHFDKVDFWRDIFPGKLGDTLAGQPVGTVCIENFGAGDILPQFTSNRVHKLKRQSFKPRLNVALQEGRYYPRSFIAEAIQGFREDYRPFRVSAIDDRYFTADLNHPLAKHLLTISARVKEYTGHREERGRRCNDIVDALCDNGPGMQEPFAEDILQLYGDDAFVREVETSDAEFYRAPRFVSHLDATARQEIQQLYRRFLQPNMKVLDLMSSWQSHLPDDIPLAVTGIGMNEAELAKNPLLSTALIQDLNRTPELPLDNNSYDIAVCSASIEYLIHPLQVMREVARILQPGAPFIVTFSNRWFPEKASEIWKQLHEFERMGLVTSYFRQSRLFQNIATESIRGLSRPVDDRYARVTPYSDPVFAVWGWVTDR
jgi:SAM-dependent methyltransferase